MDDPLTALQTARPFIAAIPDPEAREALQAAVDALLRGDDARSALGLDRGRYVQLRQARRNYFLRNAAAILGESDFRTATALQRQASRFESDIWPRWRHLAQPPATASPLQRELWFARKAWRIPGTPQQISNIIEPEAK